MQRWTALLFLALVGGTVALVVTKGGARPEPVAAHADAGVTDAEAAAIPASTDAGLLDPGPGDGGDMPSGLAGPDGEPRSNVDAGGTLLLNGEAPPALAGDTPKSVVFGAILVTYRGAQGAPPTARTREAALALVKDLAVEAKTDFKAAVAKGDKGSMENLGRMPRGVLEPAPDYELFRLGKGEVSGPIDTPKGYWIVQRIE